MQISGEYLLMILNKKANFQVYVYNYIKSWIAVCIHQKVLLTKSSYNEVEILKSKL